MVRLRRNKLQGDLTPPAKKVHNTKKEKTPNPNSELENFSLSVLKEMAKDDVPSTPSNFQIYFEKLLESKPLDFKKKIKKYQDHDAVNTDEYIVKMEREIKDGFAQIKGIVKVVSTIYKNLNVMKKIVKKRLDELRANSSQLSVDSTISKLDNDIEKLMNLTSKQMEILKDHYAKTVDVLKDIEDKAIFDSKYGVYNKKYFLNSLQKDLEAVKQHNHKSSIVMVEIKSTVLNKISTTKERDILRGNIAKLLMKTSRRSDIVAHYGGGIFAILMRHTDIDSAKKACERIAELIYGTSFFIGAEEVEMDIELGIMPLDANYSIEESITSALDILPKTGKDTDTYLVGKFSGR